MVSSRFLSNLNNRLFYLSFDKNSDIAHIEKFRNPSVMFEQNSFSFNTDASNREELFAFKNPVSNTISFAVFCNQSQKTTIYEVNESCELSITTSMNERFNGTPQFCTTNGSVIVKGENNIVKYSSNWEVIAEKEISYSDFGINQLGDNLLLLYENLPNGEVRRSFVDKHFQQVLFE